MSKELEPLMKGLEPGTAAMIKSELLPILDRAREWEKRALSINVVDEDQVELMQEAREVRLVLKDFRTKAEKVRKNLKEDSIRFGKAVQGMYNIIDSVVRPLEDHLYRQENFIAIQEEKRMDAIIASRSQTLQPLSYLLDGPVDLKKFDDDQFSDFISSLKAKAKAKEEDDKKARERLDAQQQLDRLKIQRQGELNRYRHIDHDLWEEATKLTGTDNIEHFPVDDFNTLIENLNIVLSVQNERNLKQKLKQEKLEAELAEKRKKEAKEEAEKMAEKMKQEIAEKAPDKEKLLAFADSLRYFKNPNVTSEEGKVIFNNAVGLLKKVHTYVLQQVEKM